MGLEDDLLADLESGSDFESDSGEKEAEKGNDNDNTTENNNSSGGKGAEEDDNDVVMKTVEDQLKELVSGGKDVSTQDLIMRLDMDLVKDVTSISRLHSKLQPILEQIEHSESLGKQNEYNFIISINDLSMEITNEITLIHNFIKIHYNKRFPELESLIPNALEYCQIVLKLQNTLDFDENEFAFLSKEKILVLTMSVIQAKKESSELTADELQNVLKACELLLSLDESKSRIENYVASRLSMYAPNLSEIVGSHCAAQLLSGSGGLKGLSMQPSCNVGSMGAKKSISIGFGQGGLRQEGYLYYSEIIQSVFPELRKNAIRIVSGKLVLAARTDFAGGSRDGSLGRKWKKEILEKLEKLNEPPENQQIKALPVPVDKPAKKRAGRKYRKMKQRFELSELRKAQNRMEFGKKENSVVDTFGEEIGLGMSGTMSAAPISTGNRAKVSKSMKNRLDKSATLNHDKISELFNQDFLNLGSGKKA